MSLLYSLIFLSLGSFILTLGLRQFHRKRLIEDIPTSKIRSMAMGLVEIYGEVVPVKDKILKTPLTGKDCVYYKYIIRELRSHGKHSEWVIVDNGEMGTYFYLKDETGMVLVDPKSAEIDLPPELDLKTWPGKDLPEEIKNFLLSRNLSFEDFLGINKTMRFTEYCIMPKDKVYVIGTAGDNPFVKEGWAQSGSEDIMIQKGENIYYISNKSEKEILRKLKWESFGGILGGVFLIVFSIWIIFV